MNHYSTCCLFVLDQDFFQIRVQCVKYVKVICMVWRSSGHSWSTRGARFRSTGRSRAGFRSSWDWKTSGELPTESVGHLIHTF